MTFKSYKKSPSRPFDHLYDQNYICSENRLRKLNREALFKTAPIHLIPCYHFLFSDNQRNFRLTQRNPLPFNATHECEKVQCAKYFNKNLYVKAPKCETENEGTKMAEEIPQEVKFRSTKCQTKFRESEAQTDPYLPDAKLRDCENFVPEIACTSVTSVPSLKDIETIERARCRRKWEENLSHATMQEKIEQLKVIEYENFLTREREMNELQAERLQHVLKMVDDRMNATKMVNDEILENTKRKNFCEVKKEKSKMREKMARKLRKMAKFHGKIVDDVNEVKIQNVEGGNFESCLKDFEVKKSQRIELNFKKSEEGKFRKIFNDIQSHRIEKCKKEKIKCIEERKIQEIDKEPSVHEFDDKNEQNKILIQRTLKGKAIQNEILRQINLIKIEVIKNQSSYPIRSLEGIVPKIIFELPKISVEISEPKASISSEQIKPEDHLKDVIDYAVNQAKQILNIKLLNEAEKLRQARREIQEKQEKETERCQKRSDEIKNKLEEFYNQMTTEIIDRITPIAVELIAEQDAQKFITQKANKIVESTKISMNDFEIEEEVERALNGILIPQVVKIVEEKYDEMCALIASHDLLEDLLKEMSEN